MVLTRAIKAGSLYFLGAFTLGFVFGGLRRIVLQPALGELAAVLTEIPVMLMLCWLLCIRTIRIMQLPPYLSDRVVMGSVGLLWLAIAEFVLARLLLGSTLTEYLVNFQSPERFLGLLAQLGFASFPVVQSRLRDSRAE